MRTPKAIHSKGDFEADLRCEGNAYGGAGAEEIAESARGKEQLVAAGYKVILGAGRRIQANGSDIGEVVHRSGNRADIGDVVVPGVVAIEEIEEFHEWRNRPGLTKLDGAGDAHIHLDVRCAAKFI